MRALDDGGIASAESCLQAIFFLSTSCARGGRVSVEVSRSPVALIDFFRCCRRLGSFERAGSGRGTDTLQQFRPLRLFRALRLLRVLISRDYRETTRRLRRPRRGEKSLKTKKSSPSPGVFVRLLNQRRIVLRFRSGHQSKHLGRRRRHLLEFSHLTGIGQLFEATTAQGRVATVVSILTALVRSSSARGVSVRADGGAIADGRGRRHLRSTAGVDGENRTRPPMSVPDSLPADDSQIRKMMASGGTILARHHG